MKGFFVKNYSKKQIVIDRENFNSAVCYPLAKTVFAKNFKRNPLAQSIYDDMIQEAVTRLFELSGKTKEMANEKYSENYANFLRNLSGFSIIIILSLRFRKDPHLFLRNRVYPNFPTMQTSWLPTREKVKG
jgi:hypothetical protein